MLCRTCLRARRSRERDRAPRDAELRGDLRQVQLVELETDEDAAQGLGEGEMISSRSARASFCSVVSSGVPCAAPASQRRVG